jgi:hypothetical protein
MKYDFTPDFSEILVELKKDRDYLVDVPNIFGWFMYGHGQRVHTRVLNNINALVAEAESITFSQTKETGRRISDIFSDFYLINVYMVRGYAEPSEIHEYEEMLEIQEFMKRAILDKYMKNFN